MRRNYKLVSACVMFLLVVSLTASGNSNDSFSNATLIGVSKGGTVSGSFSFNSKTDQFSKISVSFVSSVFGDVKATDPNSVKGTRVGNDWRFVWSTQKGKDTIWYSVLFNPATNQFQASGWIENSKHQGDFNTMMVAEGGSRLSYGMLSGLTVLAGILIARKKRPTADSAQSS